MSSHRNPSCTRPGRALLFLCTGNYYRSRFAEILFNALAAEAGLDWRADSRGVALDFGIHNVGPISVHTLEALARLGVRAPGHTRMPRQVSVPELEAADLVIAVKEHEHRPLLDERYPGWADRVQYWHVHDVQDAPPDVALVELEQEVRALVERLAAHSTGRVARTA